jgi:copper chaperone CopZ
MRALCLQTIQWPCRSILLLLCCTVFGPLAPAADQTVTHRITGLFMPTREADLRSALETMPGIEMVRLHFDYAEATFTYDPAKAFPGAKPADIIKRFDEKLRSASRHTLGVQPLTTTPKNKLKRIEIPVAGLDCKACCLAAYECIYKLEGVEQATASFKEGRVTALIDPEKTNRATLESALKGRSVTVKTP